MSLSLTYRDGTVSIRIGCDVCQCESLDKFLSAIDLPIGAIAVVGGLLRRHLRQSGWGVAPAETDDDPHPRDLCDVHFGALVQELVDGIEHIHVEDD